jgi:hypothetical protein
MQEQKNSHESEETPARKAWETPEVDVLLIDQTELSSFAGSDGIAFNS